MARLEELEDEVGLPYQGKGTQLKVTRALHYPQLADEISKVIPDGVSFVAEGDVYGEDDQEVTLHFSNTNVDLNKVAAVVESHVVDLNFGVSEEDQSLDELKKKLSKGDLALKDLNALLRLHFKLPALQE